MNANDNHDSARATDVAAQRIARVYAEALLNAAEKRGQAESVLEELRSVVNELFPKEPHLEGFLASGSVGRDTKAQVLNKAFEGRADESLVNFLLVLNDHERLELLRPIVVALGEEFDRRARRVRVRVHSAVPLAADQEERLRRELHDTFKLQPILQMTVDPDLLGGLIVRVDDWVYDGSVRTQLETIRNQLIERSSHEIQSRRDRFSSPV